MNPTNKDLPDPQTVEVRIVNGVFLPCRSCHYYGECTVPMGNHFPRSESFAIRVYYQCEDFTPNPKNP